MNEARRLYDLMRGYVNQEWERLQNLERRAAIDELNDAVPPSNHAEAPKADPVPAAEGLNPEAKARQILGVKEDADFTEIRRAYVKLNKRTAPGTFTEGTDEARHSEEIRKKVQWAYQTLTKETPDLEKRFGSLELD